MSSHFVISWRDAKSGEDVSLKARSVSDSSLGLTFIAISDFIFQTTSTIVNPKDEELSRRFENTKTLHLSIHSIISIEEIGEENEGLKFEKDRSNLVVFQPDGR